MKFYDWLILAMIAALLFGYANVLNTNAPGAWTQSLYSVLLYRLDLWAVPLLLFVLYHMLFRGPALSLRQYAASVLLMGLAAQAAQLTAQYLLFTGWSDTNDAGNRAQLFDLAASFTWTLQLLCGFVFLALAALALFRLLMQRSTT